MAVGASRWRMLMKCDRTADEFRNGLTAAPFDRPYPMRWSMLGLLLLVSFLARCWSAWRVEVLWSDSIYYLHIAQALENGDFGTAFRSLGLNFYPAILAVLRQTGIEWTVIGEWWSVAMGSLAVLPLFGFFRRQFDDRVAGLACLLYAVHPKLIAYCPLIIRDPTFWFFFSLTLYLAWRAVTQLRMWLFVAAGLAAGLAAGTRIEGCLLFAIVLGWALARARWVPGRRWRLAAGTLACFAVVPAASLVVSAVWLQGNSPWELARLRMFPMVWNWVTCQCETALAAITPADGDHSAAAEDAGPVSGPAADSARRWSGESVDSELVVGRKVGLRIAKSFTYPYGLFILIGLARWRRVFFRSDHQVLFLHNVLLFLAIWAYESSSGGIDLRYFLPILIIGLPYVALGILGAVEGVEWLTRRLGWNGPIRPAVTGVLLAATIGLGALEAMPCAYPVMEQQTRLGEWIRQRYGANRRILAPPGAGNLLAYSAEGEVVALPTRLNGEVNLVLKQAQRIEADLIVLWEDPACQEAHAMGPQVVAEGQPLGYVLVPLASLPDECQHVFVLSRPVSVAERRSPDQRVQRN